MKTAIELIADERQRQIEVEEWTLEHDDKHDLDEMARVASNYAMPSWQRDMTSIGIPYNWPWDFEWWKPTPDDRIRELVKAGALIIAEIERLQRKEEK